MLEVRGIVKTFGGLIAVNEAALDVPEGQIVALIGPNGAGKTTLFAVIAGFLKPDTGQVVFSGEDITRLTPHAICQRGIVRTFQVVKPFANLSVRENIAVGAHNRVAGRAAALDHATSVGESLGMGKMLDQPASALTVAGRKRLELARALATGPRLLLLDEVMAGLTPVEIDEVLDLIRGIRDSGVTVLLIEHVMRAVMRLSDHVYVLNNGAIIADGEPRSVAADPTVVEAYLGHGAAGAMPEGAHA